MLFWVAAPLPCSQRRYLPSPRVGNTHPSQPVGRGRTAAAVWTARAVGGSGRTLRRRPLPLPQMGGCPVDGRLDRAATGRLGRGRAVGRVGRRGQGGAGTNSAARWGDGRRKRGGGGGEAHLRRPWQRVAAARGGGCSRSRVLPSCRPVVWRRRAAPPDRPARRCQSNKKGGRQAPPRHHTRGGNGRAAGGAHTAVAAAAAAAAATSARGRPTRWYATSA